MELSVLERTRRIDDVMEMLGEKYQYGVCVIQRDPDPAKRGGDLHARLMTMALYPSKKYCDILAIARHLYTKRR